MSRKGGSLRLGFVGLILLVPGVAAADEFSLHALLTSQTSGTVTQFKGAADNSTFNYQIRPGFLFTYHTRRMTHELSFDAGLDGSGLKREGITATYAGGWRATYAITPRTDAETGAGVSGGRVNALSTNGPANMGTVGVVPTGQVDYIQVDASQSLRYELGPLWSLRQNGFGRYLKTTADLADTRSFAAGGGLGIDRTFELSSISLEAQGGFERLGRQAMGVSDDRDQADLRSTLRYRRNLSERWSGSVEGGTTTIIPIRQPGLHSITKPTGAIIIEYAPVWGVATLQVRHAVAPNLFLAQNEVSDSAIVNALLPLPWLADNRASPKLTFLTSTGVSHTKFLDLATGDTLATFNVASADVALSYAPRVNISLSLRYQFVLQSDTNASAAADPMLMLLGYTRHTALLTFAGRWPERAAAEVPVRSQVRVRNVTPVGDDTTPGINGGAGP